MVGGHVTGTAVPTAVGLASEAALHFSTSH
jgi:hypothetical protein